MGGAMRATVGGRAGFALIDILCAVGIIGILVAAALPMLQDEAPMQLIAGSTIVAADVEYAQSATLADPGRPVAFVVDADAGRYWLALTTSITTPIDRPDGSGPYDVTLGVGDAASLEGVAIDERGGDRGAIIFDSFGRLSSLDDASVWLGNGSGWMVVRVAATTGSVSIEDGGTAEGGGPPARGGGGR